VESDHPSRRREQRREPRTRVARSARFMLLEHPERGWGSCRITDISSGGAGLVLLGPPWPRYRSERRLFIQLDADSADGAAVPYLEVIVRHAGATGEGWLRVGVEFVLVTPSQRAVADEWLGALLFEM